jgi:hypothetical protein
VKTRKYKPMREDLLVAHLDALPQEAKDHFKALSSMLAMCYGENAPCEAVLLMRNNDSEELLIASANACDMTVAELVAEAQQVMKGVVVSDAPPKELFN